MTKGTLQFVPEGYRVVPEEKDIIKSLDNYIEYATATTRYADVGFYERIKSILLSPQLTTPPVLRWEDEGNREYLKCGNKQLACVVLPEFDEDGITWFICGEQPWHGAFSVPEARRAAEKALGFPDGLIVEEV